MGTEIDPGKMKMLVDTRSKELTLGQARAFAATLPEDKARMTGCHQERDSATRPGWRGAHGLTAAARRRGEENPRFLMPY